MTGNEQAFRVYIGLLAQILRSGQHVVDFIIEIREGPKLPVLRAQDRSQDDKTGVAIRLCLVPVTRFKGESSVQKKNRRVLAFLIRGAIDPRFEAQLTRGKFDLTHPRRWLDRSP